MRKILFPLLVEFPGKHIYFMQSFHSPNKHFFADSSYSESVRFKLILPGDLILLIEKKESAIEDRKLGQQIQYRIGNEDIAEGKDEQ